MSPTDDSDVFATNYESSPAADVSFAKLNSEHHAESSSQAESRSSAGKRSSNSDKRAREKERGTHRSADESPDGSSKDRHTNSTPSRRSKRSGGFLLDSIFANGKLQSSESKSGKAKGQNEQVFANKKKYPQNRVSADSSQRSSPLSRELSPHEAHDAIPAPTSNRYAPAVDPAQLVQMALNLSESRKRHVSSSLPVPISPAGGRRVVSAFDSGYGTVRSASSGKKRASQLSESIGQASSDNGSPSQNDAVGTANGLDGENVLYTFSPATLSRAERARRYFELASEHRRLLEHLPPLLPDSSAPENYTTQVTSSPGSAHYNVTRVPSNTTNKRQLGRPYNPLQALRNRRLRNRERRPLTAPPDTWQETDRIRHWIDGVEAASKDPAYRSGNDQVRLPTFSGELEGVAAQPQSAQRHKRTDTVSSVITRPENGWTVEPAELLADTYWMEKDDNKTLIEDRNGQRIFPSRAKASLDIPRKSREVARDQDYNVQRSAQRDESDEEAMDKSRSRRRHLLPIPGRLRRSNVNRSGSISSVSSDEGRLPPAHQFGNDDGGDENIGPLERHMRRMIAKEEEGELSSPEIASQDYWDSKNTPFGNPRPSMDTAAQHNSFAAGRLSVDTYGHRRSRSADGRVGSVDHGLSSMDELVSDGPSSPAIPGFAPAKGLDAPSPPSKRTASKRSHLPKFRSHSKERNNIEQTDFAAGYSKPLSPVMSADTSTGLPRASLDSARPSQFRRNDTTESLASSLRRSNTSASTADNSKDSNAPGGRRFFKGSRISELVRNESSRLGDRFRSSREKANESMNDSDTLKDLPENADANVDHIDSGRLKEDVQDDESDVSPGATFEGDVPKQQYFTSNLPSFKSPSGRERRADAGQSSGEPGGRLQGDDSRQQSFDRSTQGAFLAPPRINLPDDDSISNPDVSREKADDLFYGRRKSASQNDLSLVATNTTFSQPRRKDGMPVTGLSAHDSQRHWSISDQHVPQIPHKVTMRDIARIRALLLASGIKAHEIYQAGDTVRDPPVPMLSKAADTAGQRLFQVPRKEENVVAAKMLSQALSKTLANFEQTILGFQNSTAKTLGSQLEEISHRASEQLTKIVDETSDEADAFNVELTTRQPQEVKRVDEAVDAMFRQRRKQFRLFRRAGFKLLEWLVLGIMWWVWFLVVLFKTCKKIVVGIVKILRWLLWF